MSVAEPASLMRALLLLFVVVASLAGCKSSCRQLSEKMCDCSLSSSERTACLTNASAKESNISALTPADEATCAALLPKCDCHLIDTPQGKANCGLARPLVGADVDGGS